MHLCNSTDYNNNYANDQNGVKIMEKDNRNDSSQTFNTNDIFSNLYADELSSVQLRAKRRQENDIFTTVSDLL